MLLVTVATLAAGAAGGQAPARENRSLALQGRWKIQLFLDSASSRHAPTSLDASGELAFSSMAWLRSADRFGRHSLDLRPFFGRSFNPPMNVTPFGAADTSFLTEVSGGVTRDSVAIDFIPRLGHYGLSLRGRFFGDSARGRWYRRGSDGAGRFIMRRTSKEAVEVAGIPEPPGTPATVAIATPRTTKPQPKRAAARSRKAAPVADSVTVVASSAAGATMAGKTRAAEPPAIATTAAASPVPVVPTPEPIPPEAEAIPTRAAPPGARPEPVAPSPPPAAATRAAVSAATPDASGMGSIRVRLFDRGTNRWFVTQFQVKNPNGRWTWGNMRSGAGPDGWGPVVRRKPGRYEVMIPNFVCGDKFWFFAKEIRRTVDVRAGETADVSIELDLSAEPAKKTIDNKTGASCTVGPGTPP